MSRDDVAKLGDRLTRKLEQVDSELIKFGQGVETAWSMQDQYKIPNPPILSAYFVATNFGQNGVLRSTQVSSFPQVQARGTGICQRRRELYSQTFDELIRQVGEHI